MYMPKYITIIDQVGRNIIGVESSQQVTGKLSIENPVMIHVQPTNGQLQIQLVPLFFAEFVKHSEKTNRRFAFEYDTSSIATGVGFEVDEKIIAQYERIIGATFNAPQQQENAEPKVIKLFE